MLLTFTVTFRYLLLLHTGWHFWETGHTLVDAIIRMSHLFAAVRVLLVPMKSYWMQLVLMNAHRQPSLSDICHGFTVLHWKGVILYGLFQLDFSTEMPSNLFSFKFTSLAALSARLWQHVVMGFVRAWSDWSGQKSLRDFNDSMIRCFTSSDKTQLSTNVPFYV